MKKLGIVVVVVVCACLLCASESSAQAVKIGVFDMQKIVRDSKKMEGYRQILMKNIESKRKPLRRKPTAQPPTCASFRIAGASAPAALQSQQCSNARISKQSGLLSPTHRFTSTGNIKPPGTDTPSGCHRDERHD